jgi:hypothetical protein
MVTRDNCRVIALPQIVPLVLVKLWQSLWAGHSGTEQIPKFFSVSNFGGKFLLQVPRNVYDQDTIALRLPSAFSRKHFVKIVFVPFVIQCFREGFKDLRLLKETLKTSPVQKRPAPDKVENLAIDYLAELKEADLTFEKGTAVLEKYRAKYPELASYIREIVPGERRIEIRQRLEGEDVSLHLFAIRVLEDDARYEVKLSGDAEHKTVKPTEWLSLLHEKLARIVARILYARETSKPEKQDLDVSGPAA